MLKKKDVPLCDRRNPEESEVRTITSEVRDVR